MPDVQTILANLRHHRREVFDDLQGVPERRMTDETTWAGGPADVRFMFLRFADHDEEHAIQIEGLLQEQGFRQSDAQRMLARADMTRAELSGALVGLTDGDLDLTPPGEWPLRLTLSHMIETENRYTLNARYAIERFQAGLRFEPAPPDVVPPATDTPLAGGMRDFIDRLDAVRDDTLAALNETPDAALHAPTRWSDRDTDVRFRLLRIAHHEREHTAHIHKWRQQVGRVPTEAQHLLSLAWRTHGIIAADLLGLPDANLDQPPAVGGWSIRDILDHLGKTEDYLRRTILNAGSHDAS
jgi:hypothetical protein